MTVGVLVLILKDLLAAYRAAMAGVAPLQEHLIVPLAAQQLGMLKHGHPKVSGRKTTLDAVVHHAILRAAADARCGPAHHILIVLAQPAGDGRHPGTVGHGHLSRAAHGHRLEEL